MDVAFIHAVGRERADLEKRRIGIQQPRHAFARQQFSARDMTFSSPL